MTNGYVFREYIGAQITGVRFSDVPVNAGLSFHFILAFAIDYMASKSSPPAPTNGVFAPFWDTANLSPAAISATKAAHPNLSVMVGLGGDSVQNTGVKVAFAPSSVDSWVANAVSSLSTMINRYGLDGVDVDYEHFGGGTDVDTFVECIGRLLTQLKARFPNIKTSIAPFEDVEVQKHYKALWGKYSGVIDYINFQFYGYGANTNVDYYVKFYDLQARNYPGSGAKLLASLETGNITQQLGLLSPEQGIAGAKELLRQGKLPGFFIWSADSSKASPYRFEFETKAQQIVANH
ncbi:chitinase 2-like [Lolium rigidum]|uniref:chitinase 2-like n=1 Tax=Lolium rigidum TaxID=89674 RepID=UPI001F5E0117|nr:chitinase 2-like [Lolium rigidum]